MPEDADLLRRVQHLEPEALEALHQTHYPALYRYALARLSDAILAEDIASEVFIQLLDAIAQGKGPRTNLRAWLFSVASNLINDHYRRAYASPETELLEQLAATATTPLSRMEKITQQELMRAAMAQLTPDQQQVLALRYGAGLSIQETADTLDKTIGAVKQLQARAVQTLSDLVGEYRFVS